MLSCSLLRSCFCRLLKHACGMRGPLRPLIWLYGSGYMFYAGAAMDPQQSDWSDVEPHALSLILDVQHNGLDNCAAACVCASWRAAVRSAHISTLHLHANHPQHHKHWKKFLQSRSFGSLKLTSSVKQTTHEDIEDLKARGKSCFLRLPLACDSLHVGQYFTDVLHQYIHKTAVLG